MKRFWMLCALLCLVATGCAERSEPPAEAAPQPLEAEPVVAAPVAEAPAEDGDADLLTALLAAQQGLLQLQGQIVHATRRADEPDADPNRYNVRFFLQVPDRYHLCFVPESDPEAREWFISDGETAWQVDQPFADDPPDVMSKPVDKGAWGFQRIIDFVRMDRAALERDFTMEAALVAEADRREPVHRSRVTLIPRDAELADEVDRIEVYLDESHRTHQVLLWESGGNLISITVNEADYDSEIDAAVFRWESPVE